MAKTSSETQRRKSRAARKGKWPPRGAGTTVLTYPRSAPRGTGKAGENGQNSGEVGGSSAWTRPSGSRVWRHTQGSTGRPASDVGWGSSSKTAPGSLSTGSPAGRTPPHRDGSMYSQANVRVESVLRPPTRALPSMIVDTEKVLREADGSVKLVVVRPHTDGKVFAPGCASKAGRAGEEPEELKRNKKTAYIQARSFLWPELWKSMGKHAKLKEKQKWSNEMLHLENARKLRGIYFIDPEVKEFKETIKNARKKLETSVAPAMPCKIMKNCESGASNKIKTKLACILETDESTRLRMGESLPNHHEDHIAGKGENSLQHYNLVHKFIPMPQSMKIHAAKAAVDKEWKKLEKISAWNPTKVRRKKEVIDEARTSGATVHFASIMDICHLKNAELEAKHQKHKRSGCTPR